ncbi:hypothetical protein FJV41_16505 [Myxococcus llanfairpwllgwyngyllgogerychwyrndrobwllllantysiliogogogochensis]|uniref:Uncharacterized protein n=1 Tax=Myxococcus llanfairpwllgwyngyllgogerychwyrndrobwllllantysiliogogogochensis TaxID=2590453 RepID=A0A540X0Y0_9BACT|nr:hypothetical protein [Myxococcus llanfairpwllgwyngyllgogerychwyrndrobwllllantysiliogogogochensis]TQF14906.1 hypothetical protein FJV41_16505 [Myxococcus llanfairpwllgwyngyllgogerychwyrndrobwllllantysiliogogogochensis]
MNRALSRFVAMMLAVVPGLGAAQSYVDPNPYVVQPSKYPFAVYAPGYTLNNKVAWESQVAPFVPGASYTTTQEYAILQDETNRTGGQLQYDASDFTHNIDVQQAVIPEAFQHQVPPPTEIMPWTNPSQTFNKSYVRTEKFGNSLFGAGYHLNALLTAETATINADKKVVAVADGRLFAAVFSSEHDVVRGRAQVVGQNGGDNSGTAALYVLGQEVWSTSLYATYSPPPINWSRTFFSASKTFMVGPVPITVKASLSGGVKLAVQGLIGPTVARLSAIPGGWSNVAASASVDVIIVAFGVEGSLALINATLPASGEVFWPVCTLDWKLKTDLDLNTLSGTLKAFARVRILFFKKTWWVTIAQWAGITHKRTLLGIEGSQPLGICS